MSLPFFLRSSTTSRVERCLILDIRVSGGFCVIGLLIVTRIRPSDYNNLSTPTILSSVSEDKDLSADSECRHALYGLLKFERNFDLITEDFSKVLGVAP
jgi:hypothetical protein